tara:strand:- start:477 stop:1730 length:1254 start_codon:yes stop_codon:yes gene_type:complete
MLTSGAENALLKTLEEPPSHVVFVLATTEPQKVVSTIRSRTQHFEFELIPANLLGEHLRWVASDAGLNVTDEMIDYVLRVGGGSARDALSALEQTLARGGTPDDDTAVEEVLDGIVLGDPSVVISGLSKAIQSGRPPRVIGEILIDRLRNAFLTAMGNSPDHLSDHQTEMSKNLSERMPLATITRSLETIGASLVGMRQSPDPRIDLEVAVLKLSHPKLQTDSNTILSRLDKIEHQLQGLGSSISSESPTPEKIDQNSANEDIAPSPIEEVSSVEELEPADDGILSLREVESIWPEIKKNLSGKAKARFSGGRFTSIEGGEVVFALPNEIHRDRCAECLSEVEESISMKLHRKTSIHLIVESGGQETILQEKTQTLSTVSRDEDVDVDSLEDADAAAGDGLSLVVDSFPGAKIVTDE